jgi:hypothetical protein
MNRQLYSYRPASSASVRVVQGERTSADMEKNEHDWRSQEKYGGGHGDEKEDK